MRNESTRQAEEILGLPPGKLALERVPHSFLPSSFTRCQLVMLGDRLHEKLHISKKQKTEPAAPKAADGDGNPSKSDAHLKKPREAIGKRRDRGTAGEPSISRAGKGAGGQKVVHKYKCWVPASTAKASTDADCFVADISCNSTADLLGSGLSNGLLNIYKLQPSGLVLQNSLKEHSGVVLSVQFDPCTPHCLYSGSTDGTVLGWDLRSGKEISRATCGTEVFALDVSADHRFLAAGTTGKILFWDLRKASGESATHVFADTHDKEVKKVAFNPQHPDKFISSSTDGIISVFDFSEHFDEEESFIAAVNIMDSVSSFGFCGDGCEQLWCRTLTEAFHLWDWSAACSEDAPGGEGPYASVMNAREQLSEVAAETSGEIEFLLDFTCCARSSGKLSVCAGNSLGDVFVSPLNAKLGAECTGKGQAALLRGGHTESVRCLSWLQNSPVKCITGGEDGQVVAWKKSEQDDLNISQPERRAKGKRSQRTSHSALS